MLDAADGAKAADDQWPAFHQSTVHASPVMFDFDSDGVLDILLATYNGEILVIKDTVLTCSRIVVFALWVKSVNAPRSLLQPGAVASIWLFWLCY